MAFLGRILVATDYSVSGRSAVARAAQLAKQSHAELHIVHSAPDWNLFSRSPMRQQYYESVTRHSEIALHNELDWIHNAFGVSARCDLQLGGASQTILRVISEFEPHLLVLGARGEHAPPVAPASLGGTALKLIARTSLPLLLVRDSDTSAYQKSIVAAGNAPDFVSG